LAVAAHSGREIALKKIGASMNFRAIGMNQVGWGFAPVILALLVAPNLHAQSLRVTAASSSASNTVYDVVFNPAGTTLLNADGGSFKSFRSAVFVPNAATGGSDLLVADTVGGTIVKYAGPTGTPPVSAAIVWSAASNSAGPRGPDGLSVDGAGNLYVVTNSPRPQIWVMQPSASAPGGYAAPILLDSKFAGREVDSLVETVVVPNSLPTAVQAALANNGIHAGDLLALVADNDLDPGDRNEQVTVFNYSAASIKAFLLNPGAAIVPPAIALREAQFPETSKGPLPAGMDIWSADGSLLISTSNGTILQFTLPNTGSPTALWTTNKPTTFAAISCGTPPCPFHKLRTGMQAGNAYAFVTQSTGSSSGNILEFAVPSSTPTPYNGFGFTVSTAVVAANATTTSSSTAGSPAGLALAPAGEVLASTSACASAAGCDPTGGLAHVIVPGTSGVGPQGVHGNIIEQTCIVTDTRLQQDGTCPGNLSIAKQCPGFSASFIPPTICGASGPTANQFAVIQTIANGVDDVPGILVQTQESPTSVIPGTKITPECQDPRQVLGWSPRLGSDEGSIPEGTAVVDVTGFCDKAGASTRGNSIWTIGGQLSPSVSSTTHELVGFTNQKLISLAETIRSANITRPVKEALDVCLVKSAFLLDRGHYSCAARKIWECDEMVADTVKSFSSSTDNPNPYGDVRGRLGSLFYTINSRILHNAPNATWPLSAPPPSCHRECKKDSDTRGDDSRDDSTAGSARKNDDGDDGSDTCDDEDHAGGFGHDGRQVRR
jgi:hypothetical protein